MVLTCTWPKKVSFKHTHDKPERCGMPAIGRVPIGISGQLTEYLVCSHHAEHLHLKGAELKTL